MYRVLVGFNVVLGRGEAWDGPGRVIEVGGRKEVRFEPGETFEALPKKANWAFLATVGAYEAVEEAADGENSG